MGIIDYEDKQVK